MHLVFVINETMLLQRGMRALDGDDTIYETMEEARLRAKFIKVRSQLY